MIDVLSRAVGDAWPLMRSRMRLFAVLAAVAALGGLLVPAVPATNEQGAPLRLQLIMQLPNLLGFIALWFVLASVVRTDRADFRWSAAKALAVIGWGLLVGLAVELGLILLIVPGAFLAVKWSQFSWCLLEGDGGNPLAESWKITNGRFWSTLGYSLLVAFVTIVLMLVWGVAIALAALAPALGVVAEPLALLAFVYALHVVYLASFRWTLHLRAMQTPRAFAASV